MFSQDFFGAITLFTNLVVLRELPSDPSSALHMHSILYPCPAPFVNTLMSSVRLAHPILILPALALAWSTSGTAAQGLTSAEIACNYSRPQAICSCSV